MSEASMELHRYLTAIAIYDWRNHTYRPISV